MLKLLMREGPRVLRASWADVIWLPSHTLGEPLPKDLQRHGVGPDPCDTCHVVR